MNTRCIACNKKLEMDKNLNADEDASMFPNIWDGVVFRSSGQYGSRVIDEIPSQFEGIARREIQVIVCDQCLIERSEQVDVIAERKREVIMSAQYKTFDEEYSEEVKKSILEQLEKDGALQ